MSTLDTLLSHLPEYAFEATLLGMFMVLACAGSALLFHPGSPVARAIPGSLARRAIMGVLMGLTAVALILSPLGARSGAHMNPGVTLTFLVLGKIQSVDAAAYVIAQTVGGFVGVALARLALGRFLCDRSIRYAMTAPGPRGSAVAWGAEFVISFALMTMVLWTSNTPSLAAYTPLFAGFLVAVFITFEAPLSGMSMNPARSLASALHAHDLRSLWVYFTAPTLAMLAAAGLYAGVRGMDHVYCCKLNHAGEHRCIFDCRIEALRSGEKPDTSSGIETQQTRARIAEPASQPAATNAAIGR